MDSLYEWLVRSTLGLILPISVALFVLFLTRGNSAASRSAIVLGVSLLLLLAPALQSILPTIHWTIPALENLNAFSGEDKALDRELRSDSGFRILDKPPEVATDEEESSGTAWSARLVLWLWSLGAGVMLARHLWQYAKSLLILSRARLPQEPDFQQAVSRAAAHHSLSPLPVVMVSERCQTPVATGLIRPSIVIPEKMLAESGETWEMVLVHEFAHLKRKDSLRQLPMVLLQLLFWFHPFVWSLVRRSYLEVEKACDDAVVVAGYPAADYAEVLVSQSVGRDRFLKHRLLALTSPEKWRFPLGWKVRCSLVFGTMACLSATTLIHFSPWPEDEPIIPVRVAGLVAFWKFERGRGTIVADWSGHNCHGRIRGAKWEEDPEKGNVLRFDGRDDYVLFRSPTMDFSKDDFTISFWMKVDEESDGGGLVMKGDRNGVWNGGSEDLGGKTVKYGERGLLLSGHEGVPHHPSPGLSPGMASFGNTFIQSVKEIPKGEWVNLSFFCRHEVMADGGTDSVARFRIYVNGKRLTEYRTMFGHKDNRVLMRTLDWVTKVWYVGLGEAYVVKDNHFEGLIHRIMVFDRALTAEEMEVVFQRGPEGLGN